MLRTRKTLTAFGDYLDKNSIMLKTVRIEQIDAFLAAHNRNYVKGTSGMHRSILRGFLAWLHQNRILKRNFAPLIIGAPVFAQSIPPKFLRSDEIRCLFESLIGTTIIELRTAAMIYLGFYLGLRPKSSGRSLVYKLTGALELRCRAFTLWAKTDTNREETDECSETACRNKDGGM